MTKGSDLPDSLAPAPAPLSISALPQFIWETYIERGF